MNRCYLHRLSSRIVRMAEGGDQPSSFIVVDVEGDLKDFEKEDSVYEFTKSYLENTGRSGGGKFVSGGFVKNPESQKLQYVVHYANAKSVDRVLKRHEHCVAVNDKNLVLTVRPCPPNLKKVCEIETPSSNGEGNFKVNSSKYVESSPVEKSRTVEVSAISTNSESSLQDKIAEVTECSICVQVLSRPKILPCVHTFCLHCLENYGEDNKPGDQMICPICRNQFIIPDGGLSKLPNNFLIGKMVEIGKLVTAPAKETCDLCPEGEELAAKMICIDCEQIICERCSKSHKKNKFNQGHHVVALGSKLNTQNFNLRNSYCDHHPNELIKLYCYDDKFALCVLCCVESHQSHRCVNVQKAAGDFTEQLKQDLRNVTSRLPESDNFREKLDTYKNEFTEQVSKTEKNIRDIGVKLKTLIDDHTTILIQKLQLVKEQNLKAFEIIKLDIERFRVMVDSYSRYSEKLLSQGSPVDICRTADQMQMRANELHKLPVNCGGGQFRCDAVAFHPSSFESLWKECKCNNIVGELTVTQSPDRIMNFEIENIVWSRGGTSDESSLDGRIDLASANLHIKQGSVQHTGDAPVKPQTSETQPSARSADPPHSSNSSTCSTPESFDESNATDLDQWSRSIIVENVPEDMFPSLRLLLENKRMGGGNIFTYERNPDSSHVLATFEEKEAADYFLTAEKLNVMQQVFSVRRPLLVEEPKDASTEELA